MSKILSADLTPFSPLAPGVIEHLERDRWPELERELRLRRPRKYHFDLHHYGAPRAPWEWLVHRCRSWTEVERVLNRHCVDWERVGRYEIRIEGLSIHRQ